MLFCLALTAFSCVIRKSASLQCADIPQRKLGQVVTISMRSIVHVYCEVLYRDRGSSVSSGVALISP